MRHEDPGNRWLSEEEMAAVRLGLQTLILTSTRHDELHAHARSALAKLPKEEEAPPGRRDVVMRKNTSMAVIGLGACGALGLERQLRRLPGVTDVYVNPATERAYVQYDDATVQPDDIAFIIRTLGYQTEPAVERAS